jgi:hypothetical protein
MNSMPPIAIHPQKCYDCGKELRDGEQAIASVTLPLAFCVPCKGKQEETHPRLVRAFVKGESS